MRWAVGRSPGSRFSIRSTFLTANILLPAGGLFTCIFVGWKLDHHILKAQITNDGELKFRIYGLFSFLLRYVCPAVLLLIFLDNLGVF